MSNNVSDEEEEYFSEDEEEDEEEILAARPDYLRDLNDVMSSVTSPGTFSCGEALKNVPNPGLEVWFWKVELTEQIEGIGVIGLPLAEIQAKEIAKVCSLAPFGRKDQTLYDTSVRNTLQLDPSKIRFTNPDWYQTMDAILQKVFKKMELVVPPKCNLYKLLLYARKLKNLKMNV